VSALARCLGLDHEILPWRGAKPKTGIEAAAREARYRLLAQLARRLDAGAIATAHTLDDQAETVLLRMARGSGLTGLAAMARESILIGQTRASLRRSAPLLLVRPLLDLPKARLLATLDAGLVSFCDDPSNRDPRFTRARLRELMPVLAGEGLDARRLALLARRLRRAEAAIEFAVGVAASAVSDAAWTDGGPIRLDAEKFIRLPAEVALRLLGRAIVHAAGESPLRLGRLEALYEELAEPGPRSDSTSNSRRPGRVRRTLAGALITLQGGRLTIEPAPPRSKPARRRA
jgi:tRNA(Ile)-lysidine synthase